MHFLCSVIQCDMFYVHSETDGRTARLVYLPNSGGSRGRLGRRTGGLDLDVLRCRSKYSNGPENASNHAFQDPKIKKLLLTPHSPDLSLNREGTLLSHPTPIYSRLLRCLFGARLASPRLTPNLGSVPAHEARHKING